MENEKIKLFTDSSVNPQSKVGFAAYLLVLDDNSTCENLRKDIKIKKYIDTSSTKLELQTLLWALEDIELQNKSIEVYTDCQNIIGLENRRKKFEQNDYISGNGKIIANHLLYKEFYKQLDKKALSFIKVKGHKKTSLKDEIDKIFNLVDKASRNALREYIA